MKLTKRNAVQFLLYLLLTAGLVIVVMPFCYMISTSLKPNGRLTHSAALFPVAAGNYTGEL